MEMKLNQYNRYEEYVGKEVRVITPNNSYLGILQQTNSSDQDICLIPSIISVSLPGPNGKWIEDYYIDKEKPTKIRKDLTGIIQSVPTGYMEEICKRNYYFQNYKNTIGNRVKNKFKNLTSKLKPKNSKIKRE